MKYRVFVVHKIYLAYFLLLAAVIIINNICVSLWLDLDASLKHNFM